MTSTTQKILLLIFILPTISSVWSQTYTATLFSSKADCTKPDQITLSQNDGNCESVPCVRNNPQNASIQFVTSQCNASLADLDQMLFNLGPGRNFSITWWFYTFVTCGDGLTYGVDAIAVDSCEDVDVYTCKENKSTKKCVYIDPNSPQPDSTPNLVETPQGAVTNPDEHQLSTIEMVLIGISASGWAAAVLFFVLFVRRSRSTPRHAYEPLISEEAEDNTDGLLLPKDEDQNNPRELEEVRTLLAKAKELAISESDVSITSNRLGQGQCSEVYQGTWRQKPVAIKIPRDRAKELKLLTEIAIHRGIEEHPNIIEICGYFKEDTKKLICVVFELCDSQNLESKVINGDVSIADKFSVAMGIAAGMAHLHNSTQRVVHRDLKPSNILLTKQGLFMVPKIADFDYSRFFASNTHAQSFSTPSIEWAAPEAIIERQYSIPSDVWSYGATIFFLLTKQPPFGIKPSRLTQSRMAKKAKIKFELLDQLPKDPFTQFLADIVRHCLKDEPKDRPSSNQICTQFQEFFNGFLPFKSNNSNNNNIQ